MFRQLGFIRASRGIQILPITVANKSMSEFRVLRALPSLLFIVKLLCSLSALVELEFSVPFSDKIIRRTCTVEWNSSIRTITIQVT